MGAWAHHAFENDVACDWAAEFVELPEKKGLFSRGLDKRARLKSTLESAKGPAGLSAPEAVEAICESEEVLAASEVVAALAGVPGFQLATPDAYTEDLVAWIGKTKVTVEDLVPLAAASVRVILSESDLARLWADSGDEEWRSVTTDLLRRLESKAVGRIH